MRVNRWKAVPNKTRTALSICEYCWISSFTVPATSSIGTVGGQHDVDRASLSQLSIFCFSCLNHWVLS